MGYTRQMRQLRSIRQQDPRRQSGESEVGASALDDYCLRQKTLELRQKLPEFKFVQQGFPVR